MLPVIALVGRPNVGKSTLFNVLTATRDAIVADVPGLTRDRQYGFGRVGPVPCVVIDTGGLVEYPSGIEAQMRAQTERAVAEADRLLLLADARAGLSPQDQFVARELRRSGKPVTLVLNKAEGLDADMVSADFHALGLGQPFAISASHGQGCEELMEHVLAGFEPQEVAEADTGAIRIAVIGRPNVGKSTLVNRLLGEERVIAFAEPGTTRDAIEAELTWQGRRYTLVDTAGIRRKGKVFESVEKFSVVKTLQAIERANVAVLVVDAEADIAEQDAHIGGYILEAGRALVVAVNKWDAIDADKRKDVKSDLERKLQFLEFAEFHTISARHGAGHGGLGKSGDTAVAAARAD